MKGCISFCNDQKFDFFMPVAADPFLKGRIGMDVIEHKGKQRVSVRRGLTKPGGIVFGSMVFHGAPPFRPQKAVQKSFLDGNVNIVQICVKNIKDKKIKCYYNVIIKNAGQNHKGFVRRRKREEIK